MMRRRSINRISVCLAVTVMLLLSCFSTVLADTDDILSATSLSLDKGKTYQGSVVFKRYSEVMNKGDITGNVITLSRSFDSRGSVQGNVIAYAANLNMSGKVGKNLIGYFPNVNITGADIGKDVFIYTDSFTSDEISRFGSDVNLYAENAIVKGKIDGDVSAVADKITINATVNGNVEVCCNELVFGKKAVIKGNVTYQCDSPIIKTDETKILGKVKQRNMKVSVPKKVEENSESALSSIMTYFNTLSKVCALIIGLLFVKFLPVSALKIELFTRKNYAKCLLVGALASVLVFPAAIILVFTVIGLPMALHLLTVYFDLTFIALIPSALVIGGLMSREKRLVTMMLTGTLALMLIDYIPFVTVASILSMIVNMLGLGSILLLLSIFLKFHIHKERAEYVTLTSISKSRDDLMKTKQKFDRLMNEKARRKREEAEAEESSEEDETGKALDDFVDIAEEAENNPDWIVKKGEVIDIEDIEPYEEQESTEEDATENENEE